MVVLEQFLILIQSVLKKLSTENGMCWSYIQTKRTGFVQKHSINASCQFSLNASSYILNSY